MPQVHVVKSARKDYPECGIKKGDAYYWWSFRYGGQRKSKEYPRQSQLTSNNALSCAYEAQETAQDEIQNIRTLVERMATEKTDTINTGRAAPDDSGEVLTLAGALVDMEAARDQAVEDARAAADEMQESLDNMPEHLQESSDTGMNLTERIYAIEGWTREMEQLDFDCELEEMETLDARLFAIGEKLDELEEAINTLDI